MAETERCCLPCGKAKLGPSGIVRQRRELIEFQSMLHHSKKRVPRKGVLFFWRRRRDVACLTAKQNLVRQGSPSKTRTHRVQINAPSQQKNRAPKRVLYFLAETERFELSCPVRANAFRVRPVMTTSIRLQKYSFAFFKPTHYTHIRKKKQTDFCRF